MHKLRTAALCGLLAGAGGAALAATFAGNAVRVSRSQAGGQLTSSSFDGSPSSNGRYVAWRSAAAVVPGTPQGVSQVFLTDMDTGAVELISREPDGTPGAGNSVNPVVSADGRYVAYMTVANNLNGGSGVQQIVRYDRLTQETILVSRSPAGAPASAEVAFEDSRTMSGDGRWVVFESAAGNLDPADSNGLRDVFLADLDALTVERISASDSADPNGFAAAGSITTNGRYVTFFSRATNLHPDDPESAADAFVWDVKKRTLRLISTDSDGNSVGDNIDGTPTVSNNGRWAAFSSPSNSLVPDEPTSGNYELFVKDLRSGTVRRVFRGIDGANLDDHIQSAQMLPNGKSILFNTAATNVVAPTGSGTGDVYLCATRRGEPSRLLYRLDGNPAGGGGVFNNGNAYSANGRFVAAASAAQGIVAEDSNSSWDVFLVDLKRKAPKTKD